jgi:hypothetical protein
MRTKKGVFKMKPTSINNGNVLHFVKMGMDIDKRDMKQQYANDPVQNPIPNYRIRTAFFDSNNKPIFLEASAGTGWRKYSYSGKFKRLKEMKEFTRFRLVVYAHIEEGKDPANEHRIFDHDDFNDSPYTEFFLLDAINKNFGTHYEKIELIDSYKTVFDEGRD